MLWSVRRKFDWLHLCKRASDYNFRFAILRIMPPLVLDGHACIHIVLLLCVPTIQRTIIVLSHFFFCSFHLLFILLKGKFLGFVREYIYIYKNGKKTSSSHNHAQVQSQHELLEVFQRIFLKIWSWIQIL